MNASDVPCSSKMCSQPFKEEDSSVTDQSKISEAIAGPSSNLQMQESEGSFEFVNIKMEPTDDVGESNEETDAMNLIEWTNEVKMEIDAVYSNNATLNDSGCNEYDVKPELQSIKIERCSVERDSEDTTNRVLLKDAEVQVTSTDLLTCFSNIKNNSDLSVVTGIKTFVLLNEIVDKLESSYDSKYEIPGRQFKTFDRVVLTFAKLKHELSYDMLSILFQCSIENCERIFLETQERLKNCNLIPKHIQVNTDE